MTEYAVYRKAKGSKQWWELWLTCMEKERAMHTARLISSDFFQVAVLERPLGSQVPSRRIRTLAGYKLLALLEEKSHG